MNHTIYAISQLILVILVMSLFGALIYGLRRAFMRMHLQRKKQSYLLWYIAGGVLIWPAILAVVAQTGFFRDFQSLPPRIFIAIIPPLLLTIGLLFSKFFRVILKATPESWLINIQSFRIVMELLLWLGFVGGFVPVQMTFEGLNFDIVAGLTAPMAGFVFFGRNRFRRPEAILWNVFGIVLLLNIVFISVLSTPSPLRVFMNEPANSFVAEFPFIWIPGFIVPFALAMHLFALKQLAMSKKDPLWFYIRKGRGR